MEAIRQRVYFLATATGACTLVSIFILTKHDFTHGFTIGLLLSISVSGGVSLLVLCFLEYRKLKTAKLIVENQILCIDSARIEDKVFEEAGISSHVEGIEVVISCFGVLVGSKVVKFNLDDIRLKAVEIGHTFICLTYGTDSRTQKIRILHEAIEEPQLQSIVGKFRYETGITPMVTGPCEHARLDPHPE